MSPRDNDNIILDGTVLNRLRADVHDIFNVITVETPARAPQGTVRFVGDLLMRDSEVAYDLIAERWRAHQYTPMLRRHQGQIALIAQPGIVVPKPSNPWINLILAIATVVSVLFSGALLSCQCTFPRTFEQWWGGMPLMLVLMGILLAHEFGHYFAARYHKVAVTLPYFIPMPFIIVGTMGAFIQLRSPFKTKRQLFDIGVAGPLAGLVFAIPLIIWGVASSPVDPLPSGSGFLLEGNSIFYLAVKYAVHGQLLPNFNQYSDLSFWQEFLRLLVGLTPSGSGTDISLNLVAFAAWFGLFVTAMNLIPVGQLDGGHVIYCIFGERSRWLGLGMVGAMVLAGIFLWPGWLIWALLVFFVIGPNHPPPLNDLVGLGLPRKILAYITVFILLIMFMPNPIQLL